MDMQRVSRKGPVDFPQTNKVEQSRTQDNGECIEAAPFMEQKSREYLEEFAAVVPWEVNPSLNMTP